jgi:MtN3 and saliva related transmembrane protein
MSGFMTILGFVAAALTTFAFLPQVIHTYKTKSVDDLHMGTLVAFSIGVALWLVYGLSLRSWPIIFANGVTLGIQIPLIVMKFKYGAK